MNVNFNYEITTNFKLAKFLYLFLTFFASFIQLIIGPINFELLSILFLIIFSNFFLINIIFDYKNSKTTFFCCFIIFSINFFYLSCPLFSKSLLFESIKSNLDMPLNSFLISFFYFFTTIFAYEIVKRENRNFSSKKKIFDNLKIFYYPNLKLTNILFFLFLFIKIYLITTDTGSRSSTEYGDIVMKLIYGADLLFYLPFILYFQLYFFQKKISYKFFLIILFFYLISSLTLGLLINSRSIMFEGIFVIIVCFIFAAIFKKISLNKSNIIFLFLFFCIFMIFLNTLSNSILENRSERKNISAYELLQNSLDIDVENQKFEYKGIDLEKYTGINSLDRFNKIKYLDKSLFYSQNLTYEDKNELRSISINKIVALIPTNIIRLFNQNFNKKNYIIHTGSFIEYKSGAKFGGLLNRGSFINELLLITNSFFFSYFIIMLMFLILFKTLFIFQKITQNKIIFSPIIFLNLYELCYATGADSLGQFFGAIIRLQFQTMIIYFVFISIILKTLREK